MNGTIPPLPYVFVAWTRKTSPYLTTLSITHCVTSSITINSWKRCESNPSWPYLRYNSGNCLERPRKVAKNIYIGEPASGSIYEPGSSWRASVRRSVSPFHVMCKGKWNTGKHFIGTRGSAKQTSSLIVRDERSRPTSQNICTVLTNKCTQLPCDNCVHMLVKTVENELYNARNGTYKEW
jgi:hypothetical protein